ncbi:MAG: hypothetical protein Q9193_000501 [Seirophora villosa]
MVVDIGFKLDSDNFLDFEEFYYRKLNLVLETDRNSLYHDLTSKQNLQYLQRLTTIQAKLREYISKHTAERMNKLVTTCLYATMNASDQAVNISGDLNDQTWEIQLASGTSNDGDLDRNNSSNAETFAYNAKRRQFSFTRNGKRVYWPTEDMELPMLALYRFRHGQNYVTLLLFSDTPAIPCRIVDIPLPTFHDAAELIGHLLVLGYTVIQRPRR